MAKSSKDQMEEDEKKLLYELVKNSDENIETIAKHCGFSRQKTCRMITHLKAKKLIWGYTVIYDEKKIGLEHYLLLLKRTQIKATESEVDTIVSRKTKDLAKEYGVTLESSAYIYGEYDWLLTFTAKDITQAKRFTHELIRLYPHAIEKMPILRTLMFIKKHHIVNPDGKKLRDYM